MFGVASFLYFFFTLALRGPYLLDTSIHTLSLTHSLTHSLPHAHTHARIYAFTQETFIKTLEHDLYSKIGKQPPRKLGEDEEPEEDPVGAFLGRLEDDIEKMREKAPHRFREKRKPDPLMVGKPPYKPI